MVSGTKTGTEPWSCRTAMPQSQWRGRTVESVGQPRHGDVPDDAFDEPDVGHVRPPRAHCASCAAVIGVSAVPVSVPR